jgi:hypothetical protein
MGKSIGRAALVTLACAVSVAARAGEDPGIAAVLDKAIRSLGGEERLTKFKAATYKTRGKIWVEGKEHPFTGEFAVQGLDRYREEYSTELLNKKAREVAVLYGDKGYRNVADLSSELNPQEVADLKRTVYLAVIPATLLPLKDKVYKLENVADDKVGDRLAAGIRVTPPDGKEFRIYFDKETGLPVKLVANIVAVGGGEFRHETAYADYKDFGGIQKASKITTKRDGHDFMQQEITEFKEFSKLDEKVFLK